VILNMDYTADRNTTIIRNPPIFRNITVRNVTGSGAPAAIRIVGMEDSMIRDLRFENITITSTKGVVASNVQDVTFDRVTIVPAQGPAFDFANARRVMIRGAVASAGLECFLRLSGSSSTGVRIQGGDLSGAGQTVLLADGVPEDAVLVVP
jgi:hypothetical protein